jgi:glycerol-3-phosphate dehydrogenase
LEEAPGPQDILSACAGLRPLVRSRAKRVGAALSRDHTLRVSRGGLITVAGGKWTTYRKMAEDVVDRAAEWAGLAPRPSPTETLALHGWAENLKGPLTVYGADAPALKSMLGDHPEYRRRLHPRLDATVGEAVWAVRHEMARTVEDVLSRRTRALLLDARASVEAAPQTAAVLAEELGRDEAWQREQTTAFAKLAEGYLP